MTVFYLISELKDCFRGENRLDSLGLGAGGIDTWPEVLRIFREAKHNHPHDDWQTEVTHHATEIPSSYTEDTTLSSTSATSAEKHIEITSGNFTVGRKYLIIGQTQWAGSSNQQNFYLDMAHGSDGGGWTQWTDSQMRHEPSGKRITDWLVV